MAKNPLNPKILGKPIAHDGHAGTIKLTKILGKLAIRFPLTCFFTKNTVIAVTTPARIDIIIKSTTENTVIDVSVPLSKEKNNEKEKSEKRIL